VDLSPPSPMPSRIGKLPDPELLLSNLPESREAVRLPDQEQDDEHADDHRGQVHDIIGAYVDADHRQEIAQEYGQDPDEGGTEIAADQAAETADDHHEEYLERQGDRKGGGRDRAQIEEDEHGDGDAENIGGDRESRELGDERAHAHELGRDIHVADHHPGAPDA